MICTTLDFRGMVTLGARPQSYLDGLLGYSPNEKNSYGV